MPIGVLRMWWFPVMKGATIAITALGVVSDHGLSPFAQALIIALVSAIIGALGMVVAAFVSASEVRRGQAVQDQIHSDVRELKQSAGLTKRETDPDANTP